MKKAIIGFLAVGAIVGLRPAARRMARKMQEHCERMASQCRQMAAHARGRGEAVVRM